MATNKRDQIDTKTRTAHTTAGDTVTIKKNINPIKDTNSLIQTMMDKVKSIPIVSDRLNNKKIDDLNTKINQVLDKETERFVSSDSSYGGRDLALFFNNLMTKAPKTNSMMDAIQDIGANKTLEEIMNDQTAQAAILLSDKYKDMNAMYEDIRMVTEQLSELSDVIDTMRDTITNSDNIVSDISREISFGENDVNSEESNKSLECVYAMEKATKIKDKLKKIIIPEVLKYGNYFVFTQPYKDLFAKFKAMDDKYRMMGSPNARTSSIKAAKMMRIGEAWEPNTESTTALESFYADYKDDINRAYKETKHADYSKEGFVKDMEEYLANIEVINDEAIPLMEDAKISELAYPEIRAQVMKAMNNKKKARNWHPVGSGLKDNKFADGVVGMSGNGYNLKEAEDKYLNEYKEVSGVFIKLYDPRRVIPIYIMDYCIGYYVLYERTVNTATSVMTALHTLSRSAMNFMADRKKTFEDKLISVITDRICKSIDKEFLQNNGDFKLLIANAVHHNALYQKSFRVQFVPSNYMTHFKVNEDPNTHMGVSVLKRSLYYAMLYLTLLNFKIIMITTRSMDTRMFLIHTSNEDTNVSARVNKVIAEFKENQISYTDFGSVRGILSKVGKGHDLGIPLTPNGDRSFDIEVLQGQQYDLDTPLMEMLKKSMISNTGCPSAIQNAFDEIDFARQLPAMHVKYAIRMITMQEETEDPATELYRKILSYGDYGLDDDTLAELQFKWSRPKTINITNLSELLNQADQMAEFMIKIFEGENSTNDARVKDRYFKYLITNVLMPGVYDWKRIFEELKEYKLDMRADLKEESITAIKTEEQ